MGELVIPKYNAREDESKYIEFNKLIRELGYPTLEMYLTTEIRDMTGELVSPIRHERAHSWTRNAYNFLLSNLGSKNSSGSDSFMGGYISIKVVGGTIQGDTAIGWYPNGIYSVAGIILYGIIAGTSNAGYSFEDYNLGATITHGTGGTQMAYSATINSGFVWTTVTNPSDTGTATIKRYLNNNSGGSIGVNEIGLVYSIMLGGGGGSYYNLVARDVLVGTDTVPDAAQYTITYTIVTTLPA